MAAVTAAVVIHCGTGMKDRWWLGNGNCGRNARKKLSRILLKRRIKEKEMKVLDMNDPAFNEKLLEETGIEPGDSIIITTPHFDRAADIKVVPPASIAVSYFYETLPKLSDEELRKLGVQKWNSLPEYDIWLYPAEWYDAIPSGLLVVDINDTDEQFIHGVTDNDTSFGALAIGFRKYKC